MQAWAVLLDRAGKIDITLHPTSLLAWQESDRLRIEHAATIARNVTNVEVIQVEVTDQMIKTIKGFAL